MVEKTQAVVEDSEDVDVTDDEHTVTPPKAKAITEADI
jgi:hypothetical protein